MTNNTQSTGPTLNDCYNDLLKRWADAGHPSKPECEDCGCDLTGKEVWEGGFGWFCSDCIEANQDRGGGSDHEDFHSDI